MLTNATWSIKNCSKRRRKIIKMKSNIRKIQRRKTKGRRLVQRMLIKWRKRRKIL